VAAPVHQRRIQALYPDRLRPVAHGKPDNAGPDWYGPAKVIETVPTPISGDPELERISTSHIERANLSFRTQLRCFTRFALGFSKKLDNLKAAVTFYVAYYNLCRVHRTLRVTPAMEAGVTLTFGASKRFYKQDWRLEMSEQRDNEECSIEIPSGPTPRCGKHKVELLPLSTVEVGYLYPNPHDQEVKAWECPLSKKRLMALGPIKG
jgi:hypothetical protein